MGRVNRYKKTKACDPNSKQYGKKKDTKHDEPPEIFEKKNRKMNTDRDGKWDDEQKREQMLQREALRDIRQTAAKDALKEKKIEPKRDDESMQEFKARIRKETRKTLAEEITKMTSTAVKRKLRLKERSQKRKAKKGGNKDEEDDRNEVQDFYSAENGHLRPSDLGESRTTFRTADEVVFGETSERPPDLNSFTTKFRVTNVAKNGNHSAGGGANKVSVEDSDLEDAGDHQSASEEDDEDDVPLTKNQRNKKRKLAQLSRNNMDGDDGLEIRTPSELPIPKNINVASGAGKMDKHGKIIEAYAKAGKLPTKAVSREGTKDFNEMAILRGKVQEAYKLLKEKRRLE